MKRWLPAAIVAAALVAVILLRPGGDGPPAAPGLGPVPVRVETAALAPLARRFTTVGTLEALLDTEITSKRTGKVAAVHFRPNQEVAAGELLVELEADVEEAALREAEAALAEERRLLARYRALADSGAIDRNALEAQSARVALAEARLAAARAAREELTIRAPFAGVLGLRLVSPGTLIEPGTPITTLDAVDVLKVVFALPEEWVGRIAVGDPFAATSPAHPGQRFEGRVHALATRVDPATRLLSVRGRLDNRRRLLRPGMGLAITVTAPPEEVLAVSEEALAVHNGQPSVYRVVDGRVERVAVEVGERFAGRVEIRAGLAAGDLVVREGTQKIRDGARVEILAEAAP
ncbi:MAG: MexH family multidrug efflux RND transporter periplasmic adaptor subunit [Porticoccaceae bacterium]|nr:MAG: MexH family multidrug efflux RND transporter periplasmic adaptor subunit [Porticoccaceae bacterium]